MMSKYSGRFGRLLLTPRGLTVCGFLLLILANQVGEDLRIVLFIVGIPMVAVGWGLVWAQRMNPEPERDDKDAVTRPPKD